MTDISRSAAITALANEIMVNRALHRDVAWVGSAQAVEERYRRFWVPAHELYEQLISAPARAHAFVDNQVITAPKRIRHATKADF